MELRWLPVAALLEEEPIERAGSAGQIKCAPARSRIAGNTLRE